MNKSQNICLFFYVLYFIVHIYVFSKVKSVFYLGTVENILLGLFLLFMAVSPFPLYIYTKKGPEAYSRIFAYIGYLWVALLIMFFPLSLTAELYNLTIKMGNHLFQQDISWMMLSPVSLFFIPLFLSIAFNTYGYFEAKKLKIERVTVKTSKLPEKVDRIKIALLSDLHLGIIIRERTLDRVLKEIKNAEPDLIVSTGDLIDGVVSDIDDLADRLRNVHAKFGKFAVTGNHEFYAGITPSLKFTEDAGFTVLRGEVMTVGHSINIAGVDNPEDSRNSVLKPEEEILSKLPSDKFTLLLKHKPNINKKSLGFFDLQVSGHTHKGQIFPVSIITSFFFQHHSGFTYLPKNSALYVSRGIGSAGPPIRFLAPPELTIIEVVSANKIKKEGDYK